MIDVKWADFKLSPMKFLKGNRKIKVKRGNGSYLIVTYYSPYIEDGANKIKKVSKRKGDHRCSLCGSTIRVLWVVPFDLVVVPGWYCYNCRRKRDILDVNVAKKHGKIV